MRNNLQRQPGVASRCDGPYAANEERETALLAEFMHHNSVASLAGAIAGRLGRTVRAEDLVAHAGLTPKTQRG